MTRPSKKENQPTQINFCDDNDVLLNAPIGVFTSTPDGRYISVNHATTQMLGYENPHELISSITDIASQVYADPADRIKFMRLMEKRGEVLNHECRFRRRDGTEFWVSRNARALKDEDGRIVAYQGFNTDITDSKQAEKDLIFQNVLMKTHLEVSPDGILIVDENFKIIFFNQHFVDLWEIPDSVMSLQSGEMALKYVLHKLSNPDEFVKRIHDLNKNKQEKSYEEIALTCGKTLERYSSPMFGPNDEYYGRIWHYRDITYRKNAELALSKSQKLMARAEELADLGSWQWDIKNDTWLLSDNWKKIHGCNDIILTTSQLISIAHPEDRPAIEEAFAMATERGEPYDIEHRIIRQSTGEVRYIHARGLVEMDDSGKPLTMFGAVHDITKLRQAQNLLVKSEARFRSLFENSPVAYQSLNKEGQYIDVNDRLCDLLGYERSEIMGKHFSDLWSKRTRSMYSGKFELFKCSGCTTGELELTHKSGATLFVLLEGRIQLSPEGKFVRTHCILSDITERKKAEDKIRLINQQLERANDDKNKLFSIIAHDLKSPMAGIFNTSQILAEEAESLPLDDIRFISAAMHKNMENALALLNDLMQWARLSQGGMDFSPEKCGLCDIAKASLNTARDVAGKKDITIKCDIPTDLVVLADQPMINTVIRNIIFNAVKFTPQGGNISITASNTGSDVEVCVQDDGIGMNDSILSSIFTADKNKRQLGTDGEKGTGLGLIMCKEFVEKHDGKIWVKSIKGQGTTVYFTLPGE